MSISLLQVLVDGACAFCLTETLIYITSLGTGANVRAGGPLAISNDEPASQEVRTLRDNLHSSAPSPVAQSAPEHPVARREQRLLAAMSPLTLALGLSPPRASARGELTGGNWEGERYLVHCSFPLSCLGLLVID